ncbi:hypothetical protein JCM31598_32940 [Desulfonatronum parangueonense]
MPASNRTRYRLIIQREEVPDEAFTVVVPNAYALPDEDGAARYRDEFDQSCKN